MVLVLLAISSVCWSAQSQSDHNSQFRKNPDLAVVEQARENLSQKHDRTGAVKLLLEAIEDEKVVSKKQELIKEVQRISKIFISNEGQKQFELAESLRYSGQGAYLSKYQEALKTEGPNVVVLLGQALGYLGMKNCKFAKEVLDEIASINPFWEEAKLLRDRTEVCLGQPKSEGQTKVEAESPKELALYKKIMLAQRAFNEGQLQSSLKWAREAITSDPSFPMGYFWAWRAITKEEDVKEGELVGLDEAQNYLAICKGLSPAVKRKYYLEPDICTETESVEDFVKKMESATI